MTCAWKELLDVLPAWLAQEVDRTGKESMQELRLRLGQAACIVCAGKTVYSKRKIAKDDITFCINAASRYSPWASGSAASGYITAPGGHRIGLCGEAVIKAGEMTGLRRVTSVCIRVCRDFPGIAAAASNLRGSILMVGPPGSGKTTLLRDLVRQISATEAVSVVDERGEVFPECFQRSDGIDVLTGCPKSLGIDMVLRCMGPQTIAVDEITASDDCDAMLRAGWCGVRLIATAHAATVSDLKSRPLYRPLVQNRLFDHILVLSRDKSWHEERMMLG